MSDAVVLSFEVIAAAPHPEYLKRIIETSANTGMMAKMITKTAIDRMFDQFCIENPIVAKANHIAEDHHQDDLQRLKLMVLQQHDILHDMVKAVKHSQ